MDRAPRCIRWLPVLGLRDHDVLGLALVEIDDDARCIRPLVRHNIRIIHYKHDSADLTLVRVVCSKTSRALAPTTHRASDIPSPRLTFEALNVPCVLLDILQVLVRSHRTLIHSISDGLHSPSNIHQTEAQTPIKAVGGR